MQVWLTTLSWVETLLLIPVLVPPPAVFPLLPFLHTFLLGMSLLASLLACLLLCVTHSLSPLRLCIASLWLLSSTAPICRETDRSPLHVYVGPRHRGDARAQNIWHFHLSTSRMPSEPPLNTNLQALAMGMSCKNSLLKNNGCSSLYRSKAWQV